MEIFTFFGLVFIFFLLAIPVYSFTKPVFFGAPYAVTTQSTIDALIKILEKEIETPKERVRVVDLGSGDGRIVIALARSGFEAHGFELNPLLVTYSRWKIRQAKLHTRAYIHQRNYWGENLSSFDVVAVFGISYMMKKLEKKLKRELRSGSLVVSNYFSFPDWKPTRHEQCLIVYKKET